MLSNIENGAAHVFKWLPFISSICVCYSNNRQFPMTSKSTDEGKTPGSPFICHRFTNEWGQSARKHVKLLCTRNKTNYSCQMDFEALARMGESLGFMRRYTKHLVYPLQDL
jgi:hypothetical protein